jgi:hypothetical protein
MSSYELMREQNIQRNISFLLAIGLNTFIPEVGTKIRQTKHLKRSIHENDEPLRKSSRIANIVNSYTDNNEKDPKYYNNQPSSNVLKYTFEISELGSPKNHSKRSMLSTNTDSDPTKCRNINANYNVFLTDDTLCQCWTETGKAAIVSASNNNILPRFSKYSGALEWRNCIYLWVNLGDKNTANSSSSNNNSLEFKYDNTFLDGGRSFVWFGGSKMNKGIIDISY